MSFEDEETRLRFHTLPTHTQYEWAQFSDMLARQGRIVTVLSVTQTDAYLQVNVRIDEQLERSSGAF